MTSAVAPLAMSVSFAGIGITCSIWLTALIGVIAALAFIGIAIAIHFNAPKRLSEVPT
ncbi:hypothetical protein ACWGPT_16300 [Pseudorhizobium sp. NPDC055634]